MPACIGTGYGQCSGFLVADLVVQVKSGRKNVGRAVKLPLCATHAIQGGVASWLAHRGEKAVWSIVKAIEPAARRRLHLTYKVVPREPYKSMLKKMGIRALKI